MERDLEPSEGTKVTTCADCGDDLMAGEDVVKSRSFDLFFCNLGCAGHYVRQHQEELGKSADVDCLDTQIVTLEAPEDHWTEEDALREDDDL